MIPLGALFFAVFLLALAQIFTAFACLTERPKLTSEGTFLLILGIGSLLLLYQWESPPSWGYLPVQASLVVGFLSLCLFIWTWIKIERISKEELRLWGEIVTAVIKLWSQRPPVRIYIEGQTYRFVSENADQKYVLEDAGGNIALVYNRDVVKAVYGDHDPQEILRRVREESAAFFGEMEVPSAPSQFQS